MTLDVLVWALAGFIGGSLPFAVWISRLKGQDIRQAGSGNPGATNVGRTLGWGWGALVLVLDAAKVALPTWHVIPKLGVTAAVITALAGVLGHTFSPFLRFKGGKGVASALGGLLVLHPPAAVATVAIFVATVFGTRIVSLGSLTAALALPIALWLMGADNAILAYGGAIALMVILRHRANLKRLMRGEEPKLGRKEPLQP